MLKILKELLKYENDLMFKYDKKMFIRIRPSNMALCCFTLMYIISGIDLFPEKFVSPKILAFVDDVALLFFTAVMLFMDLGGIVNEKISVAELFRRNQRSRVSEEVNVHTEVRSDSNSRVESSAECSDDNSADDTSKDITGLVERPFVGFDSAEHVNDDFIKDILGDDDDSDKELYG